MLELSISTSVLAGLLLVSAGVQAAGTFPSAANEFSTSLYSETAQRAAGRSNIGAMQPIFPSAAIEHGLQLDYVDVRRGVAVPSAASSNTSVFPSYANEVL